jgi:hypothetical protein
MPDRAWLGDMPPPPPRAVSLLVSAALVAFWGWLRLIHFSESHVPIAYVLPLLVCLWTRDRQVLWGMAGIFVVFHTLKVFWILPPGAVLNPLAIYTSTLVNITAVATAIHAVLELRTRLESSFRQVQAQADELAAQGEELAQQNEELSVQAEELSEQGEELVSQNEELSAQAEEIGTLNTSLERREALLQTLLETARISGSERTALEQIGAAARDLFDEARAGIAIYEAAAGQLRLVVSTASPHGLSESIDDAFVRLVVAERRTASLHDAAQRPDLVLAALPGLPPARAALCAPVQLGEDVYGALAIYSAAPHAWTDEEFHLAEWLASLCARVLQTLRVQATLRDADRRKSEFLATLSHELRNPLTAIGFALNLIEGGRDRDGRGIEVTRRQLRQLVRLVDDLLDATRLSSNKIQIRKALTDLRPIVEEAVEASRHDLEQARHRLSVRLPERPHARTSREPQRPLVRYGRHHAALAVRAGRGDARALRRPVDRRRDARTFDPATVAPGDIVGIGIHTGNALRGYASAVLRANAGRRRVRRHPRDAVSRRGARARRRRCRRQRRRRPGVAARAGRLRGGHPRSAFYDGGRMGATRSCPRAGTCCREPLHVGIGADGAGLPEALLVLLGLADRRAEAAPAPGRRRRARGRRAAAQGLPVHPARRRQLLPGDARRPGGRRAPERQAQLPRCRRVAAGAVRADGPARAAAGDMVFFTQITMEAAEDPGVPGRHAPGAHQGARSSASSRSRPRA